MDYPLYEELLRQVIEKKDNSIDVSMVCSTINSLAYQDNNISNDHYNEIAALILHHELIINSGILLSTISNDGKLLPGNKGILYNFLKLPPLLKQIIAQYIEFYSKV